MNILFNCGYGVYLVCWWMLVWLVVIVEKGEDRAMCSVIC